MGEQPRAADAQGDREAAAEFGQPGRGLGLVGDPPGTAESRQQLQGAVGVEDVELEQGRAVQDEFAQAPGAGRQYGTAPPLRQEGGDLGRARHVVQDHQHPVLGGQVPVEGRTVGEARGKVLVPYAEGTQADGEGLGDVPTGTGAQPGEVDENLSVGEARLVVVGPLAGGGRLADSGEPAEDADRAADGVTECE